MNQPSPALPYVEIFLVDVLFIAFLWIVWFRYDIFLKLMDGVYKGIPSFTKIFRTTFYKWFLRVVTLFLTGVMVYANWKFL